MGRRSYAFMKHLSDLADKTTLPSGKVVPLIIVSQMQHPESRMTETETLVFASSFSPYVTTLHDIGTYTPVAPLPGSPPTTGKEAMRRMRFDVKKKVDEAQDRKARELMGDMAPSLDGHTRETHMPRHTRKGHKPQTPDVSVEELLKQVDAKIEQLDTEAREKASADAEERSD